MNLRWTYRAQKDLKTIGHYIARNDPLAARRWVDFLKNRANKISLAPLSGRIVPEVGKKDIREVIEGNYRIVYKIKEEYLDILTIFEGHHLFPLDRLPKD